MSIDVSNLQALIDEQNQQNPFSGTIMVREGGKPVFARSYGFANKAEAIPNTPYTRFGIASGAKIFTAVVICQLVENGLLGFDSRLKDCLNVSFPQFDPAITVHHLLTHTSGIPDYFDEEEMGDTGDFENLWKTRPVYTIRQPSDFLPMFQDLPMKFAPGTRWSYSNAGFIVLGLIVEQVSGLSFTRYVEQNLFKVCDMQETGYFPMDCLPARTAYGYIPAENGEWRTNIFSVPVIGGPDGGAFTTVGDMAKFWDCLLGNRLMGEEITRAMLTPHAVAEGEGEGVHYGYGIWMVLGKDSTLSNYFVVGEDPGVAFMSSIYPNWKVQYTIIGNTTRATWPVQGIIVRAVKADLQGVTEVKKS